MRKSRSHLIFRKKEGSEETNILFQSLITLVQLYFNQFHNRQLVNIIRKKKQSFLKDSAYKCPTTAFILKSLAAYLATLFLLPFIKVGLNCAAKCSYVWFTVKIMTSQVTKLLSFILANVNDPAQQDDSGK